VSEEEEGAYIYTSAERVPTKCNALSCARNERGERCNEHLSEGGLDAGLEREDEPLLRATCAYMLIYLYAVLKRFMMEPA